MGIYRGSRYVGTPMYVRDSKLTFKIREMRKFNEEGQIHEFTEGDTLDGIAFNYYGDSQLWWVLLEANSKYRSEIEIRYGDEIFVPSFEEVVKSNVGY